MANTIEQITTRLLAAYGESDRASIGKQLTETLDRAKELGFDEKIVERRLQMWLVYFPFRGHECATVDDAVADLRKRVLYRPSPSKSTLLQRIGDFTGLIFRHYAAVAGLAFAAGTALYATAYADFYGQLNTTPGRVGLSTSQIVVDSATGGVLLVLLIALALFLTFFPIAPIEETAKPSTDTDSDKARLAYYCAQCGVALLILISLGITCRPPLTWIAALVLVNLVLFKAGFKVQWKDRRPILNPKPMRFQLENYLLVALIVTPMALVLAGLLTISKAADLGREARSGEAIRDPSMFGVRFLAVRAEPAMVSWPADGDAAGLPACALYLGSSAGQAMLYDSDRGTTIQAPLNGMHLRFPRYRSSCDAPLNIEEPTVKVTADGSLRCKPGRWHPMKGVARRISWSDGHDTLAEGPVLHAEATAKHAAVQCAVTVSTALGSDTAFSGRTSFAQAASR